MRILGWLLVGMAPVGFTFGNLLARENIRAYGELCRRGRVAACLADGTTAAWTGLWLAWACWSSGS